MTPDQTQTHRRPQGSQRGETRPASSVPSGNHSSLVLRVQRPQLERRTPIVPSAVARQVVEEASRWLGQPLPARYAAGLAQRARRIYAHSPSFRRKLDQLGDAGRNTLYVFMRHWLAARLHEERPALYRRLPAEYSIGQPLPVHLSNEARLLSFG